MPEHGFRAAKGRGERGWNYADLDLYLDPPVKVKTAFRPNKAGHHYTPADKEVYLTQAIAKG